MKKIDSTRIHTDPNRAPVKNSRLEFSGLQSWLFNSARPRKRIAMMMRLAFLFSSLTGAQSIQAQDLPLLNTLPVSIAAGNFVSAGSGKQFVLAALTSDRGFVTLGPAPTDVYLKNVSTPQRMPNESSFMLYALDTSEAKTFMLIDVVSTNRSCLLTTIDPVLNQAKEAGRVIEITSTLLRKAPLIGRSISSATLCTMDSGKLAFYFSTPGFDMLQLTAVSYGTPSNVLRTMSSQSTMLYFPTSKF